MPKKLMTALESWKDSKHVIQAFLKVDLEWASILLYDSKSAATRGLHRLERLEPSPKHQLRVRKWNGEDLQVLSKRDSWITVAA